MPPDYAAICDLIAALFDGTWQVVSLIWDVEGPDRPLPEEFRG